MKRAFSFGDSSIESAVRRVNEIHSIAIIGAGTMGQGIAIDILRKTDYRVILVDVQAEALTRAKSTLENNWKAQVERSQIRLEDVEVLGKRVYYTQRYDDLSDADVIWEVATERIETKTRIFEAIEKVVNGDRIAAVFSNTSSHTTSELARLFKSSILQKKFLTVHGYFPFEANRLIDVMKGELTSAETFIFGIVFSDQILEKTVIALEQDHHGYITDPIFQAMAAIISWDVRSGADIVQLGGVWDLFSANPFNVLDQTGHMPYVESSRHFGGALPRHDRLRSLYLRDGQFFPSWIARLQERGCSGVSSSTRQGFFEWSEGLQRTPQRVYDPATSDYVSISEICRKNFGSYHEAAEQDRRDGKIKSVESLLFVAGADDHGGRAFRRYVLPICLYALDLIQDGVATPGQVNLSTRAGLRFKVGMIELIDALIAQQGIDGVLKLIRRTQEENADDPCMNEMLDVEGKIGPRRDRPNLLLEMKRRNINRLLGYGKSYQTPVAELNWKTGRYEAAYPDLKVYPPSPRDRVAGVVFNNPLRGNVFNKANIDQLEHAIHRILRWHHEGTCGAVLFTAAGTGMRMLGADAREFNRGWFDRAKGYVPLTEPEAAASSRNAVNAFRLLQKSPVASIGVFGEKWGGGAEFTYYLDMRYDVRSLGYVFDPLTRQSTWQQKNNYNQPELDYAILPGFGAAGELKRLGLGDSAIFEIFDQGITADRAYALGLCNGVYDDDLEALRRGYDRARQMAKDAPYSRALFKMELERGADDEALATETGETFNPEKNPFVSIGLLSLLDRQGKAPPMSYSCKDTCLPGWNYPDSNGEDHP